MKFDPRLLERVPSRAGIVDDAFPVLGRRNNGIVIIIKKFDHVGSVNNMAAGNNDASTVGTVETDRFAVGCSVGFQFYVSPHCDPFQISKRCKVIEAEDFDYFFEAEGKWHGGAGQA